jgi:hypothetical protein
MECALVKNINTKAGLTNGTVGTIVAVCYEAKDVPALLDGKHPQPYCVIMDFPNFKGFDHVENDNDLNSQSATEGTMSDDDMDVDDDEADCDVNACLSQDLKFPVKTWVAIFPTDCQLTIPPGRQAGTLFSKEDRKYRKQFPFVPAKNMTAHKSQGQTWTDRIIYISTGLHDVIRPNSEQTTLFYTAGTRSNKLENCLFEFFPLETWLQLGKSKQYQGLLRFEKDLREKAKLFASEHNNPSLYVDDPITYPEELSNDERLEWEHIKKLTTIQPFMNASTSPVFDYAMDNLFSPANIQGVIAFDFGSKNTGVAVLTRDPVQENETLLNEIKLVNLNLPSERQTDRTENSYSAMSGELKFLGKYFVDKDYENIRSWSIVVEYFQGHNTYAKVLFRTLEQVINELRGETNKCVHLKACNTKMIHNSNSPLLKLDFTTEELEFLNGKGTLNSFVNTRRHRDDIEMNDGIGRRTTLGKRACTIPPTLEDAPTPAKRTYKVRSKKNYKKQKEFSSRLIQLLKVGYDLSHIKLKIAAGVRASLKDVTKCDDLGDALLHGIREFFGEPSKYRTFVPGQTLFQSNRCIVVRFTIRWFSLVVFHVENNRIVVEHVGCHKTVIEKDTVLKNLTINDVEFLHSLPESFKDFLDFEYCDENVRATDTIHILLRHSRARVPHSMLQLLKKFVRNTMERREDFLETSIETFFKYNRTIYRCDFSKQLLVQETSGKHIDARQLLPTFLKNFSFTSKQSKHTKNMLDEEQIYTMYGEVRDRIMSIALDVDELQLDKLIIPRTIFEDYLALETLKTNNSHNNFRGPLWIIDLVLCGLNVSVIRPHFKGSRS